MKLYELAVTHSTNPAPMTMTVVGEDVINIQSKGLSIYEGDVETAAEQGYKMWQWDGHGWQGIYKYEHILRDEEPVEATPTYTMDFPKRGMFQRALREYLDSFDVRSSAPLVRFMLDTNPPQKVEMVLRDVSEVDDDVCVYVGRPKEDSSYGPKIYVLSKAIIGAEVEE